MSKFTARIEQDTDAENPRKDRDCFGHMVCWHSRYDLGDEMPRETPAAFLRQFAIELDPRTEDRIAYWEETRGWSNKDGSSNKKLIDERVADIIDEVLTQQIVSLNLYLYDHSGITMRTSPFCCPRDSGQVGLIYVTRDEILKEYDKKVLTQRLRDRAQALLQSEVEEYDQYLTGDIWWYNIEDAEGNMVDSCGGFYGADPRTNGMFDYVTDDDQRAALVAAYEEM